MKSLKLPAGSRNLKWATGIMEEKRRVVKQICKKLSAIPLFTATDFLFFLQAFFVKQKMGKA